MDALRLPDPIAAASPAKIISQGKSPLKMKDWLIGFLWIAKAWCFSREIISTDYSTGLIRYTTSHNSPHFLAIEYPSCIVPHLISTPLYKVIECKSSIIAIFRLKGQSTLNIFYEKELSKIWQYSPYIDEGVVIKAAYYVNNDVVWMDAMVDWAVIPDFTVQFVAFNSFGVVFTLLLKIYCCIENVIKKPRNRGKVCD